MKAASAFCLLHPSWGRRTLLLAKGLMAAADLGMLLTDFPGAPGGGYCASNGLIVCVDSLAIMENC